jgi:signal transduction histidine kinase
MQSYARQQRRTLLISIVLFAVLAAIIITVGYRSYRNFEAQSRTEAENWLSITENSKLNGLANWRKNLLNYANLIYKNQAFSDSVALYFENEQDAQTKENILQWLQAYQENSELDRVDLLGIQGEIRLSFPEGGYLAPEVTKKIPETVQSGKITFVDFYKDPFSKQVYLNILVPVIDNRSSHHVIGLLSMQVNPQAQLYPYLSEQVTNNIQTQSFLTRQDGDKAVILTPLQFEPDAALNLLAPMNKTENISVKATQGLTGIMEGVDYREVPMIATAQSVPDSPWFLVTHVNTFEVNSPVQDYLFGTIVVTGVIIFYSGLGVVLIWRQREMRYYQSEAEAAEALRKTKQELLLLTSELDNKVQERTEELRIANQELHLLSQQMVDMQEKQIKNLARELHDSIGQNLTAINLNLSLTQQLLPKNSSDEVRARLIDASSLVEEVVTRMRNVIADFLPPMLESYGLSPALSWYCEQFTRRTNIRVQVKNQQGDTRRLAPEAEVGLFRIAQEALNNTAKHAHASHVDIELKNEDEVLLMIISDDGLGFDPHIAFEKSSHWGLAIMRERARSLGASLEIQSVPNQGVKIILRITR